MATADAGERVRLSECAHLMLAFSGCKSSFAKVVCQLIAEQMRLIHASVAPGNDGAQPCVGCPVALRNSLHLPKMPRFTTVCGNNNAGIIRRFYGPVLNQTKPKVSKKTKSPVTSSSPVPVGYHTLVVVLVGCRCHNTHTVRLPGCPCRCCREREGTACTPSAATAV